MKKQSVILFDDAFTADVAKGGVSYAIIEKERAAKRAHNGKPLSASEHARTERMVRRLVNNYGKTLTGSQIQEVATAITSSQLYADFPQGEAPAGTYPAEVDVHTWARHLAKSEREPTPAADPAPKAEREDSFFSFFKF